MSEHQTEAAGGLSAVDRSVGRGRHLGAMYIARRKCGKVSAMCWDDPGSEKDTAKHVASYIKRGDSVERVDRYENDPQPEWICRSGCTDCVTPNVQASGGGVQPLPLQAPVGRGKA